jgi:hypothetical protein
MEARRKSMQEGKKDVNINFMKKYFSLLSVLLLLAGCATKVDPSKAQKLAESFLEDVKNENYNSINQYYTSSFNESEPLEKKIEKFQRLKNVMGAIQSYELISSKENYDSDKGLNELELKYKVKCEKLTVDETFLIINDEGEEKIIFQNIENAK